MQFVIYSPAGRIWLVEGKEQVIPNVSGKELWKGTPPQIDTNYIIFLGSLRQVPKHCVKTPSCSRSCWELTKAPIVKGSQRVLSTVEVRVRIPG